MEKKYAAMVDKIKKFETQRSNYASEISFYDPKDTKTLVRDLLVLLPIPVKFLGLNKLDVDIYISKFTKDFSKCEFLFLSKSDDDKSLETVPTFEEFGEKVKSIYTEKYPDETFPESFLENPMPFILIDFPSKDTNQDLSFVEITKDRAEEFKNIDQEEMQSIAKEAFTIQQWSEENVLSHIENNTPMTTTNLADTEIPKPKKRGRKKGQTKKKLEEERKNEAEMNPHKKRRTSYQKHKTILHVGREEISPDIITLFGNTLVYGMADVLGISKNSIPLFSKSVLDVVEAIKKHEQYIMSLEENESKIE